MTGSPRIFRLIESSLVVLFFVQAVRVVFAVLLGLVNAALDAGQINPLLINAHLFLGVAFALAWFSPRARSVLPEILSWSAILVAVARVFVSFNSPLVQLYAALAVIGVGGGYLAMLLRANYRTWLSALVAGLVLDQLSRAWDTYDLSLRVWFDLPVGDAVLRVPWLGIQIALSLLVVVVSRLARRSARQEPYEPAFLPVWGGMAFGAFLAMETIVLSMPAVVARWAAIPYVGLVPWMLLATGLPLVPAVRRLVGEALSVFDEWLRGWVWLLSFLLMIAVGNRLNGTIAAAALIVAQFMAVLTLWWIPAPPDPSEVEQVGPSVSLGLLVFFVLTVAYSLVFEYARAFVWLRGQGVVIILLASALLGLARLFWREQDPWLEKPAVPRGVAMAFVSFAVVFGLILAAFEPDSGPQPFPDTVRIATYNINGGYDAEGVFQLELAARTIEASLADIVVLQEVDAGRPLSYGVDEVQFLARRLDMYQVFWPTVEQLRGIAVLSRWPLTDHRGALLTAEGEQIGAVYTLVQGGDSDPSLAVLGAQLAPGGEEKRLEQMAVLLDLLGDASPAVLAADLAAPPDDVVYQQLINAGFVDPDRVLGIEHGFTTPAYRPTARHDYVLVRGLVPLDARQVDSVASDHRLVVVEAGWP